MGKPSYQDLVCRVKDLEQLVNLKVYPNELQYETIDLLSFRLAHDWFFDFIDRKIGDLTGYDLDEFVERKLNWLDLVHEDDRWLVLDALQRAIDSDKYFMVEHRIVKKQGAVRWVKIRGRIFRDDQGAFYCLQGMINDITSQKYVEMALESEHQVFGWVADNMDDGIYIVSRDHEIKFMNKALVAMVGDHVGERCYQALFQRDSVCPWSVMNAIQQQTCGVQEYQWPQMGKTFQVRSYPIKSRDGSIGKLGQLRDITHRRELQSRVLETEARHQAIVDAANMADLGIFIIQDHDGMEARFRYANQAFCRITGFMEAELQHKSAAEIIHEDNRRQALERYRRGQRGEEEVTQVYEVKLVRNDATVITVLFSVAPSSYEGRAATVGFVRDITERKKTERSLLLSQRLASIGKLAAEIAHEINNPLTSILTFANLLDRIVGRDPFPQDRMHDLREYVGFLCGEANRCAGIARNLLDFSRQSDIDVKENDIHQILERTIDILRHRAELGGIRVITDFALGLPHISCDFKRLQQAFINILWNAMEAMPDGGVLTVISSLESAQEAVRIEITDTGTGIPEESLDKVFEPFFTTKDEGKGVGLGLSVAYGIIRQHRGQIQVQSQVGKGTQFNILLRTGLRSLASVDESLAE